MVALHLHMAENLMHHCLHMSIIIRECSCIQKGCQFSVDCFTIKDYVANTNLTLKSFVLLYSKNTNDPAPVPVTFPAVEICVVYMKV